MASKELLAVLNAKLLKGVHAQCKDCEVLIPKGDKCRLCGVHSYDDMETFHEAAKADFIKAEQEAVLEAANAAKKLNSSARVSSASVATKPVAEHLISKPLISCVDGWLVPTIDKDPDNWVNHEAQIGEDRDELLQRLWKIYDPLPTTGSKKTEFLNLLRGSEHGEKDEAKRFANMLDLLSGKTTIA